MRKKGNVELKDGLIGTCLCWHPDLTLPVSRNIRNKCLLFLSHPVYGLAALMMTQSYVSVPINFFNATQ
jgi:hypothetical protein